MAFPATIASILELLNYHTYLKRYKYQILLVSEIFQDYLNLKNVMFLSILASFILLIVDLLDPEPIIIL